MKLNGWRRLWIVGTGLYLLWVVGYAIRVWPTGSVYGPPSTQYYIGSAIGIALVAVTPPSLAYGLGSVAAWVRRGFDTGRE